MKIAILGESPADEAALEVLVQAILGRAVERSRVPSLRARGIGEITAGLPRIIASLHFNSDATALVIVVDSNGKSMHRAEHDVTGGEDAECRLCAIRATAHREIARLGVRPGLPPLRVAVGMAVPALEAWLLVGREAGLTEANWKSARAERPPREPYTRARLKQLAYGTIRPTLDIETQKMTELMREVVKNLAALETAFPSGFGPLQLEIETWKEL